MKNLILIRHGKSNWDVPFKDIDRPLDKRGMQDAHLVSSNIADAIPKTYILWSSTAKRAADTALIFSQNLLAPIDSIVFKPDLYTFDDNQLEKIIKSCDDSFESLILFGHNGAITDFVNKFGDVFIDNVPTTGFVSLQFDTDCWKKINNGRTKKIITPKDLKKESVSK
ncbi:SixA phosphatase family protein [Flavobacterium algicola]|uniref:SixA phosphatase family protein n=1 Tax=Flavobacterium algicola TaxID=556529 RepID=UPI001EFD191D|nr:phosphoglycerate mutase family protein [Flavobacterium algicola]MCG9792646.1 histidine phosphatase family protein [Flavobacterium algicola]